MATAKAIYRVERDEIEINRAKNSIAGIMTVPLLLSLQSKLGPISIPIVMFIAAAFTVFVSSLIECVLRSNGWANSASEAAIATFWFTFGGSAPMVVGLLVSSDRLVRIIYLVVTTGLCSVFALTQWSDDGSFLRKSKVNLKLVFVVIMVSTAIIVWFGDLTD